MIRGKKSRKEQKRKEEGKKDSEGGLCTRAVACACDWLTGKKIQKYRQVGGKKKEWRGRGVGKDGQVVKVSL